MSRASDSFNSALQDVTNLLQFHAEVGGVGPGKRAYNLSSLNKSALVLLCATWESYVEFVIIECAERHIYAAITPDAMRGSLSKLVGQAIKNDKDERAWRNVAGDGWRSVALSAVRDKVKALNTPKTTNVSSLFRELLDVKDIENDWVWHKSGIEVAKARLDDFVTLRGSIAHGEQISSNINKVKVTSALDLINKLIKKIELRLLKENLL